MKDLRAEELRRRMDGLIACCVLLGAFSGFTQILPAEEQHVPVGPGEIVESALEHSYRLRIGAQEVEAADAGESRARAGGLVSLDVSARAAQYAGLEDSTLGPGITIPGIEERYGASAVLRQPLYTGGETSSRIQAAHYRREAAEAGHGAAEADVRLDALTAYWRWAKAFQSLGAMEAAANRMELHSADMENLRAAGLATENDALATSVLLDRTRLQRNEAQRRLQLAGARIAFLTGAELPDGAAPEAAGAVADAPAGTCEELLRVALTNRLELVAREMESQAAGAGVRESRAERLPSLYFTAGYEAANPNSLFFPPAEEWNEDGFAAVVLNWNLLDSGLRRAATREAVARENQSRFRREQEQERIVLEVREAFADLQDTLERVTLTVRAAESARRNLTVATEVWRNGLALHADVLDAHASLTAAEYEAIAAHADALLARAALDHATGLLRGGAGGESGGDR